MYSGYLEFAVWICTPQILKLGYFICSLAQTPFWVASEHYTDLHIAAVPDSCSKELIGVQLACRIL